MKIIIEFFYQKLKRMIIWEQAPLYTTELIIFVLITQANEDNQRDLSVDFL